MKDQMELLELAWGLIANANQGNWDSATPEWHGAAIRWRDEYHRLLAKLRASGAYVYGEGREEAK